LRFKGVTIVSPESSFLVLGPAVLSSVVVDSLAGLRGKGESGSGRSSKEKIERSSPFHWSPKR
jgi:hypothetical protein